MFTTIISCLPLQKRGKTFKTCFAVVGRFKTQKKTVRYNSLRSVSHLQTIFNVFFIIAVSIFDPCPPNNDNNLTVRIWSAWSRNKLSFSHKNQYGAEWYVSSMNPLIHQDFEYFTLWSFVVPGTWVTLTITGDMRSDKTTRQQVESNCFSAVIDLVYTLECPTKEE